MSVVYFVYNSLGHPQNEGMNQILRDFITERLNNWLQEEGVEFFTFGVTTQKETFVKCNIE